MIATTPSLAVATSELCDREAYPDHRLAAVALTASLHQAAYPCPTCTGWHLGETGPVRRCSRCHAPVFWERRRGDVPGVPGFHTDTKSLMPVEPDTGKPHGNSTCRRLRRSA